MCYMNNPRISPKERNLLKGAMRRVFSRSDLRKMAIELSRIQYTDPGRPRVTKWSRCPDCLQPTPTYKIEVDHIIPIVPLDRALSDMTWDEVVNNIWCELTNLVAKCRECHYIKTKAESKQRRLLKKGTTK